MQDRELTASNIPGIIPSRATNLSQVIKEAASKSTALTSADMRMNNAKIQAH